jgi:hypothetical protein
MDEWKLRDTSRVGRCYRQFIEAHVRQRGQQLTEVDAKILASKRALDGDFPDARRAEIDIMTVVLQKLARFTRQSCALRRSPEQ